MLAQLAGDVGLAGTRRSIKYELPLIQQELSDIFDLLGRIPEQLLSQIFQLGALLRLSISLSVLLVVHRWWFLAEISTNSFCTRLIQRVPVITHHPFPMRNL